MAAYYNENDPKAVAWLRELIKAGLIAKGDVDDRSIADVVPADVAGYEQAHFFAGIGGWSYALRLAGWPDDRPVWTGSCPCQPFSVAGSRKGTSDSRHLWPEFRRLILAVRPPVVFGEQVASADGLDWLSSVLADLEAANFEGGAVDLCAAGVGAPHIRQRLYWVAVPDRLRLGGGGVELRTGIERQIPPARLRAARGLEDADLEGRRASGARDEGAAPAVGAALRSPGLCDAVGMGRDNGGEPRPGRQALCDMGAGGMEHPGGDGREGRLQGGASEERKALARPSGPDCPACDGGGARNPWAGARWLYCRDGKVRPTQSRIFPLADGVPGRMGLLRGYGNAIVPQVAQVFIEAFMGWDAETNKTTTSGGNNAVEERIDNGCGMQAS